MKKFIFISSLIFLFNSAMLFSLDCYSYKYNNNTTYAIAISPSTSYENEYIVGVIEIDPLDVRWTISTRTIIDEDGTLKSIIDVNFPIIRINQDSMDIEINKKYDVVLHLNRVDKITYNDCEIAIPLVFSN